MRARAIGWWQGRQGLKKAFKGRRESLKFAPTLRKEASGKRKLKNLCL